MTDQASGQTGRESAAVPTGDNMQWSATGVQDAGNSEVQGSENQNLPEETQPSQEGQDQIPEEGTEQVDQEQENQDQQPQIPQEITDQLAQLQAQNQQLQDMLNFFQNKANENFDYQEQQPQEQQQFQQQPEVLPPDIKAPENWETQTDQARYYEHQANKITNKVVNENLSNAWKNTVAPAMKQMAERITGLQLQLAKMQYPDYDDVVKEAWRDAWVLDETGTRQVGIRNKALHDYLINHPNSYEAAYKYGLSKRAPQKIKQGIQKNTQKIVQNLQTKPKGPTQFGGAGAKSVSAKLDWNTPPALRDKILAEQGVIPK